MGISENEKEIIKSLQIPNDSRYEKMHYYRSMGGTASQKGHFARLCKTNRRLAGLNEEQIVLTNEAEFGDIAERELEEGGEDPGWQLARTRVASIEERIEWQETFDKQ